MKLFRIAQVAAFVSILFAQPLVAAEVPFAGVWSIWSNPDASHKYVAGSLLAIKWDKLESSEGKWNFSTIDNQIRSAVGKGRYVGILVYHGENAPDWVYNKYGVPRVKTVKGRTYPYYLHPSYKPLLIKLIKRVARHLKSELPANLRKKIVFVQAPVGSSGDPQPYNEDITNKKYAIGGRWGNGDAWSKDWSRNILKEYYKAYKGSSIKILVNYGGLADPKSEPYAWVQRNLPGAMIKAGRVGHRYSLNNEKKRVQFFDNYVRDGVLTRDELDHIDENNFSRYYEWNIYWMSLFNLHLGQTVWNIEFRPDEHKRYQTQAMKEAFNQYTKYAPYSRKSARTAPGAWIALRDGLDAADSKRFSSNKFGSFSVGVAGKAKETSANHARMKKILKEFSRYGAVQGDSKHELEHQVSSWFKTEKLNDVAYNIYDGNYEFYIHQIDPRNTSQGYWRQGPSTQPYGRYARGFDGAKNKNAMYFDVDNGFLANATDLVIRVVYLDKGRGKWALKAYSSNTAEATVFNVRKTGTGKWKEVFFKLNSAIFKNKGPRASDLVLSNTDGENDIFHMIEVLKKNGSYKLPSTQQPSVVTPNPPKLMEVLIN